MSGSLESDETQAAPLQPSTPKGSGGGEIIAGRYEILGMLGQGGMGCVYRARDNELDEIVALKMLHGQLVESDGALARFRQEVKLARRVTHRNVARTYDIGEHAGSRYLTMELVEGESLATLIERTGALPIHRAIEIAIQVCHGLVAAHTAGVVHRDLKPDNVSIGRDGRVVLLDFGIARAHLIGEANETSGQISGTPAYMAPEQVEARTPIDGRADIYAFGEIVFEMLTGKRAWPGDSPLLVAAERLFKPPPDVRLHRPDVPTEIADVVLRCLARDRNDRYADAREIERVLLTVAVGEPSELPVRLERKVAPDGHTTLAVLPFRNLGDQADDYLAVGLTDDLIDVLSMTRGLRVRARASHDGSKDANPEEIGRRLGVDVVAEGSVRKIATMVRVNARLVGVRDGFQLWASRFEKPFEAALTLNDEVARAIALALSGEHAAPARAPMTDPKAVELHFRGRIAATRYWMGLEGQQTATAMLEEALQRTGDDATMLSSYIQVRARSAFLGVKKDEARDLEARVKRSLVLAPHLGEPWVALAAVRFNFNDDAAGALRALRRAIVNAPSLADAYDLAGRLVLDTGDIDEARQLLERALWLDTTLPFARADLMRLWALRGRLDEVDAIAAAGPKESYWQIQMHLASGRFHMWWGSSGAKLPPTVLTELRDPTIRQLLTLTTAIRESRRVDPVTEETVHGFVAQSTAGSRGRRLFAQMAAELFGVGGQVENTIRYVSESVDAGLRDLPWMDLNPLLAAAREKPVWGELRERVRARTEPALSAWRGPPATVQDLTD